MDKDAKSTYEITLIVDGKRVPTNFFVKEMLGGGVTGMIGALKGIEDPRKIELTVEHTSDE